MKATFKYRKYLESGSLLGTYIVQVESRKINVYLMFPLDSFPNITDTCSFVELDAAAGKKVKSDSRCGRRCKKRVTFASLTFSGPDVSDETC